MGERQGETVVAGRAAADHLQRLYEASQRLNRTLELDDLYQAVSEYMLFADGYVLDGVAA